MSCYSCGESTLLEVDGARTVCTRCGTVLEENAIVSEITFGETGGGAAMVQGSYVGADQTRARAPAGYRQKGGSQESREQTMLNGRRRIQELAHALRLPDRLADAGQRYFNLAVNMNFVQGRRTQYVVAACLYSACRMDKTSHMLIDFSDLLEINVFVLGSTYLKLVKELSLQLPIVDPSLYISRFAALLEFGEETQKVAQDAVRLVARMGRDWMHIGRRPAGVCGACLVLAARMNNFRRSITEVVQVVKIADVTLRRRLAEFKDTPSGALTVADFRTLWLDETADPPAFSESQKREKKERESKDARRKGKENAEGGSDDEMDASSVVGNDEQAERDAFAELAEGAALPARKEGEVAEDDEEGDMAPPPRPSAKKLGKRKKRDEDAEDEEDDGVDDRLEEPNLDDALIAGIEETLEAEAGKAITTQLDENEQKRMAAAVAMTNLNTSDRLDDLDEAELDCFILTEAEVKAKSRLWMEINKDYLKQLADKQTGPDGELKPAQARRRKRHRPRDSQNAQGTSAADATKQLLTKKRFSKKINYQAIENLFGKGTPASSVAGSSAGSGSEDEDDDASSQVDAPLIGLTHGPGKHQRSRGGTPNIRKGQAIQVPNPTFSRGATPMRSSSVAPAAHEDEEEEHEQPEEEEDDWRAVMKGTQVEEEDYGDY
ncbi:hypothetical protein BCR35DRAFT_31816 [Leucosporidium creatinivorum]|uniref:B-related factor 1 n=1 Tax=Leucosporidium creatinivorum TaxID=106004 RepID=A0A1Y2FVS6_9BASI|nr:hypothetical protein BCR35DRAFT_31816 [Leucosporidium creatinivorum]